MHLLVFSQVRPGFLIFALNIICPTDEFSTCRCERLIARKNVFDADTFFIVREFRKDIYHRLKILLVNGI